MPPVADHAVETPPSADFVAKTSSPKRSGSDPPERAPCAEREARESLFIAKLKNAGRLHPGLVLRALFDGELARFEAGLAALLGTEARVIRIAIRSDEPELLAVACVGAGIDRSVYPALLTRLRDLTDGWPRTGEDSARRVAEAFDGYDAPTARLAFQSVALAA